MVRVCVCVCVSYVCVRAVLFMGLLSARSPPFFLNRSAPLLYPLVPPSYEFDSTIPEQLGNNKLPKDADKNLAEGVVVRAADKLEVSELSSPKNAPLLL